MTASDETKAAVKQILLDTAPYLDEKQRRILFGSAAAALGHGGISFVKEVTGSARNTISSGMKEISSDNESPEAQPSCSSRIRKAGAGRKTALAKNPLLYEKIEEIIVQNGDFYRNPEMPLLWTTWSLRMIAAGLTNSGIYVSQNIVARALEALGYSKHQNHKMYQAGEKRPDRTAQFQLISETSEAFLSGGEPVISIETQKIEDFCGFMRSEEESHPGEEQPKVSDYDHLISELKKVPPYGLYFPNDTTGFLNLTFSRDPSESACISAVQWWRCIGERAFPEARRLYIICESDENRGFRKDPWKQYIQKLANETRMEIHVSYFPTGTSKWNKIGHRLIGYRSVSRKGQPVASIETILSLIGPEAPMEELPAASRLYGGHYEPGMKISEEPDTDLNIEFAGPNEKWNYIIRPGN